MTDILETHISAYHFNRRTACVRFKGQKITFISPQTDGLGVSGLHWVCTVLYFYCISEQSEQEVVAVCSLN